MLLTGEGFDPPQPLPDWGVLARPPLVEVPEPLGEGLETSAPEAGRFRGSLRSHLDRSGVARVGILFYKAHFASGNDAFVHALADAVDATGEAVAVPIYCSSLRGAPDDLLAELGTLDALVVTVLAAGGTKPATSSAGGDDEAWDVEALAALDIPVLQGLCLTWDRATWAGSDDGVSPLDAATQVAVPEFDGRIITTAFSFKETDDDGLPRYVADPERCARVAGIAVAHARLRHTPREQRRIALVLSAYPTKHSRVGNAVGLDTPLSAVRLLRAMRDQGYTVGDLPGLAVEDDAEAGNALIHALIDAGGQDPDWLTAEQLSGSPVRIPAATYRRWFEALPEDLRASMTEHWGEAPGSLYVDGDDIVLATLQAGNLVLLIQPPRGFGENPVAIYHDPDLPPSHHYVAAYRWLEEEFGAHAAVHLGKHGSLEWLPGKTAALSASCATDAALGNLPLVYPFLVNDPGEGAQAKRRAHATIVDHLVPPMARAEAYGDIARLEQLMDEHANIAAMDPAKLPAIRAQIWTLIQAAQLDHDLGLDERPHDAEFDDFLLHVDGWLCEIKDAQIRDGLHVLGQAPAGEARVNLVLAILRASQVWGGQAHALPGLRAALGLKEQGSDTQAVDAAEATARALVEAMEQAGWPVARATVVEEVLGHADEVVAEVLAFAAEQVVPRLDRTTDEMTAVLHALDGGFVPAGPVRVAAARSGQRAADRSQLLHRRPQGGAVPARLRHRPRDGRVAGRAVRRRHRQLPALGRPVGLGHVGDADQRRRRRRGARPDRRPAGLAGGVPSRRQPRGGAAPGARSSAHRRHGAHLRLLPRRVPARRGAARRRLRDVAELDEPADQNYVRAHALADQEQHGDWRRATTRIFGSKPGAYGAGLLPLIESGSWRTDADLAEVYTAWGGFAYGRDLDGAPAGDDMRANYRRIAVAAKNTDTREHDIADSDDYFQYHGGMVATVRALTGESPAAYIGDSTTPDAVRTRSLTEETARVFRSRVVNPRWVAAMQRHGYKGAFEMAATVDYLFGYDATAGVVADWMYESLAQTYVLDPGNQAFLREANPWALHSMVERLSEAAERGLWASPDEATLDALRDAYLEVEGDLEDRP